MSAALVVGAIMIAGAGTALAAPPATPSRPGGTAVTGLSDAKVAQVLQQQRERALARGATRILAPKVVPYIVKGSRNVAAQPLDYPVGCGLFVTEYYRPGPSIEASTLTDCQYAVSHIVMAAGIARLDLRG
uniref:hypothetical protein n=1 Tax=Amycolatopsis sp. CA-151526 TaxID=3239921 RepID=UPI003F498A7F